MVNVKIANEQQVFLEATEILLKSLTPAKMARFIASWQKNSTDYLDIKEQLFKDETVETLYPQILKFQASQTGITDSKPDFTDE